MAPALVTLFVKRTWALVKAARTRAPQIIAVVLIIALL
jgi:hypothetical protein